MSFSPETRRWRAAAAATCLWALAATPASAEVAPVGTADRAAPVNAPTPQSAATNQAQAPGLGLVGAPSTGAVATEAAFSRLRTAAPGAHLTPRLVTGLRLSLPGDTHPARALAFVAAYGDVFGLSVDDTLVQRSTRGRTVRLEQQHAGVPVRNAGVTFAFAADGRLMGYTNETQAITRIPVATMDAAAAVRTALTTLGVPDSGLTPVTRRTLVARGGEATVVYEIDLLVRPPLDIRRVLVDAVAGRVIGQESLVKP